MKTKWLSGFLAAGFLFAACVSEKEVKEVKSCGTVVDVRVIEERYLGLSPASYNVYFVLNNGKQLYYVSAESAWNASLSAGMARKEIGQERCEIRFIPK